MDTDDKALNEQLAERFRQLPPVVQKAITSADVQTQLRALADTHKLHLDQWTLLENEVMLALLGFQPAEDLADNLKKELDIDDTTASALAADVSRIVFVPIREQLERELEGQEKKSEGQEGGEGAAAQAAPAPPVPTPPLIVPATPPAPRPEAKVARAPATDTYKPGQTSAERREIHEDPYREPPQ